MVDFDRWTVHVDVVRWRKTFSNQSQMHAPGSTLAVDCRAPTDERDFRLSTEVDFRTLELHLDVVPAPIVENNKTLQRGIGILTYFPSGSGFAEAAIGGWFCLNDQCFKQVWSEISSAVHSACHIIFDVAPVRLHGEGRVWDVVQNPTIYILGAAVQFSFEPRLHEPERYRT